MKPEEKSQKKVEQTNSTKESNTEEELSQLPEKISRSEDRKYLIDNVKTQEDLITNYDSDKHRKTIAKYKPTTQDLRADSPHVPHRPQFSIRPAEKSDAKRSDSSDYEQMTTTKIITHADIHTGKSHADSHSNDMLQRNYKNNKPIIREIIHSYSNVRFTNTPLLENVEHIVYLISADALPISQVTSYLHEMNLITREYLLQNDLRVGKVLLRKIDNKYLYGLIVKTKYFSEANINDILLTFCKLKTILIKNNAYNVKIGLDKGLINEEQWNKVIRHIRMTFLNTGIIFTVSKKPVPHEPPPNIVINNENLHAVVSQNIDDSSIGTKLSQHSFVNLPLDSLPQKRNEEPERPKEPDKLVSENSGNK